MSITPFEALAVAPKSQEASFIKTAQQTKENSQQVQLTGMLQAQAQQKLNRAEKPEEKSKTELYYDAKEKGSNAYAKQQERERQKKEQQAEEERKRMLGCTFDITV